jgi:ubiquitin-like protein Pup
MPQQVHATRTPTKTTPEEMDELAQSDAAAQQHELVDQIDDLLDEIDSVLEENAEDFVRAYIQKGGQ